MAEAHRKCYETENRSNVYGLLASVFSQEITSDFLFQIKGPRFLGALTEIGVSFQDDFFEKPEAQLIEALAVEYTRLFLGPGKHISPHESIHHQLENGKWGQFWGDSTVAVKKFIESAGFDFQPDYKGIPDHISVELEFMQQVTLSEAQAWKDEDKEKAAYCLNIEKKFMEEHLVCWIPSFCEKVLQASELPFYKGFAELTQKFIKIEKEELTKELV